MSENQIISENGIIIIRPTNYKMSSSDCNVCGLALRHKEDVIEHKRIGCCIDCSLYFYQPNRSAWSAGWRPSEEEVKKVIKKISGE